MGGVLDNESTVCHRSLTPEEQRRSSTWRELQAVIWGLRSFSPKLAKRNVMWHIDNYAALRVLNVGSKKHDLQQLAFEAFEICKSSQVNLKTVWIPRELNTVADGASKIVDIEDWKTTSEFFLPVFTMFGDSSQPIALQTTRTQK